MKKLILISISLVILSCNKDSPNKIAETMLELSIKGNFPNKIYTSEFDLYKSFDYEIYVKDLIPIHGKNSIKIAENIAEQAIQLPNGIKSFEFVRQIKQDSVVVRSIYPLQITKDLWVTEGDKEFYINHCNGVIDYVNQYIEYDVANKAAKTILVYKVMIDGLNKDYIFGMIKYFDEWKIYGITPAL